MENKKITNQKHLESIIHNLGIVLLDEVLDKKSIVHLLYSAGLEPNDLKQFDLQWMLDEYGF